jgi:acetyltransferase
MENLKHVFEPKSIAVVGVSSDPKKLGSVILSNLIESNYEGKLYPINPKYDEIHGMKCYKSVSEVPEEVELVCISVPAKFVKTVIEDSGKAGAKGAIIITAGFREVGEEGQKLEEEIIETAKNHGIRLLGPNCLGAMVPSNNMNVSFSTANPPEGDVAFISQSGAFCTAILDLAMEQNLGFSHFVSLGNKSDISENELIDYFQNDSKVKVIGGYLEEVLYGQNLLSQLNEVENPKPLIVFKPGKSNEAKAAISSHTGSLAGSIQTYEAAVKQGGIVEAEEIDQMFYLMMGFSWADLPKGKNIGLITNAGGPGIIATDLVVENGLNIAKLSDETKKALREVLPAEASVKNPVDVIGDAPASRYSDSIEIMEKDENVDAILVILTPQRVTQIEETAKLIINTAQLSDKPIFPVFVGGKYVSPGLTRLYDNTVPAFRNLEDAIMVLAKMNKFREYVESDRQEAKKERSALLENLSKGQYSEEVKATLKDNEVVTLPETLVSKIAVEVGIDIPGQIVANSVEEALEFAGDKFPVVMKATTDAIAHKTDVKALYLNIDSEEKLRKAYAELEATIKQATGKDEAQVLLQEQIISKEEIFIGMNRDGGSDVYTKEGQGFGHLMAIGKGGIYTEVYKDMGYALVPSTEEEISEALRSTNVFKVLDGARGLDKLATEAVIKAAQGIQKMAILYPEIISFDLNPLLVTEERAVAVDLKVFVQK